MKLLSWISEKLVRRIVVPLVLFSVLALVLAVSFVYLNAKSVHQNSVVSRLRVEVDLYEAQLHHWIEDQKQSVQFLTRTALIRDRLAEILAQPAGKPGDERSFQQVSAYLNAYIHDFPDLREIMVLSNTGGEVLFATRPEHAGLSFAHEPFFLQGQRQLFVQGLYLWSLTDEPTLTVSAPLYDAKGAPVGVLAAHLEIERIAGFNYTLGLEQPGEFYMVDRLKRFVSTDHFRQYDSAGVDRDVVGKEAGGAYLNYAGEPVVGYSRWLPDLEIALFAEIGQAEAFAPARHLGGWIVSIVFVLTVLLIAFIIFVTRRIAAPLQALSDMAKQVAEGDLSLQVPVVTRDETGRLAESFNSMVAALNAASVKMNSSVEYFRSVFQLSPDALAIQKADSGVFVTVNDKFCAMFGHSSTGVIGVSDVELHLWQKRRDYLRYVSNLRKNRQTESFSSRFLRTDGGSFPGIISSRLIELEDETYVLSVLHDVSKMQQVDEALRKNQERLQLLIDRMPIACISWEADMTASIWNPEAEKIFGYTQKEAVGKHAFDLIVPRAVQPQVAPVWQSLMAGNETVQSENENVTRDGRTIVCDWYNTPLKNSRGETVGVISMARDISGQKQAEETARHKTDLLQLIMNAIPAPIFFKDADGVYRECNYAFMDFLGFEYDQIIGHTAYDVAPEEKARVYEAADRKLLEQGGLQSYEASVRYADGTDREVLFHKAVFNNPDGNVAGMVGVMLDVSEIKSAQSAQLESEQSYREIFNASSEAIIVRDLETGKVVDVNRAMLEMYGYTFEEALETSIADLTADELPYSDDLANEYVAGARAGIPQLFEWRGRRKDGTAFWVEIALKKSDVHGRSCLLVAVRNIEGRKRFESALIESEDRFRHLVENAADALILHDDKGQIVSVNQRCCDRLGYRKEELLSMSIFQIVHGVDSEEQLALWQNYIPGRSVSFERVHLRKDGSTFPVEVNTVSYDSHGCRLYIAVARDVSERKLQEAELAKYRSQLETLVRERTRQLEDAQHDLVASERLAVLGQLTATVSHELRNPLGTVKNAIYLLGRLKDTPDREKVDKALDLADRNVRRCDSIISELLDFTRQHEGEREEIDVGVWVQSVLADQVLPNDVELNTALPSGVIVSSNPERLRRALINVFSNAVQAFEGVDSDRKNLSIDLSTTEQRVQIVVTDNGSGISSEVLPRIFEPMFSTKNFGVGLGMAIVKNIMEEQGGGVELSSRFGEGTVVSLWLPQRQNLPLRESPRSLDNDYSI